MITFVLKGVLLLLPTPGKSTSWLIDKGLDFRIFIGI